MDDETEPPQRIARLTPLTGVLARIDALVTPVEPRQAKVAAAHGYVLAADVVAPSGLPAAALALRDGFALQAEATTDAGGYAPAVLRRRRYASIWAIRCRPAPTRLRRLMWWSRAAAGA